MLSQHKYYVYHEAEIVYARMDDRDRVALKICANPQEAYDYVQSILNPTSRSHDSFAETDKLGRKLGFLSKEFQDSISDNCEEIVKSAYSITSN